MLNVMSTHAPWLERAAERPRSATTEPQHAATGAERTAAWRVANDRRRRPESDVVAMALLLAVVRDPTPERQLFEVMHEAIEDLVGRGFERDEVHGVIRRWRRRVCSQATKRT
ncbi:hypothetical protein [Rhodopseudomonas palustris]|uniref:hypothetical protein n=1 Tax=Rhodopseudomonas palustris TaxID=1076 RepID=UPI0021F2CE47|nr:hypothetical protein [Rhodopseudomonas palustris]UYO55198.1 hypothetical protein KQX61_07285 [Rhodopseudomonas palustris]